MGQSTMSCAVVAGVPTAITLSHEPLGGDGLYRHMPVTRYRCQCGWTDWEHHSCDKPTDVTTHAQLCRMAVP